MAAQSTHTQDCLQLLLRTPGSHPIPAPTPLSPFSLQSLCCIECSNSWAKICCMLPEVMQDFSNPPEELLRGSCQATYITLSGSSAVDNGVIFWCQGKINLLLLGTIYCPILDILCKFMENQDIHHGKYSFHYSHKRPTVLSSFVLCLLKNSYFNFMISGWFWPSICFILSRNVVFQTPFFLVYRLPAELPYNELLMKFFLFLLQETLLLWVCNSPNIPPTLFAFSNNIVIISTYNAMWSPFSLLKCYYSSLS